MEVTSATGRGCGRTFFSQEGKDWIMHPGAGRLRHCAAFWRAANLVVLVRMGWGSGWWRLLPDQSAKSDTGELPQKCGEGRVPRLRFLSRLGRQTPLRRVPSYTTMNLIWQVEMASSPCRFLAVDSNNFVGKEHAFRRLWGGKSVRLRKRVNE